MKEPVAVLGGGIQGCLIALALTARGIPVHLYERESSVMSQASLWNEGKLHLGFVYAGDSSMLSSKLMARAAFQFVPTVQRLCSCVIPDDAFSEPFVYGRHQESIYSAEQLEAHYAQLEDFIRREELVRLGSYPGYLEGGIFHKLPQPAAAEIYSDKITDAWATAERSVDPVHLAEVVKNAIAHSRLIECRLKETVTKVSQSDKSRYLVHTEAHSTPETYQSVVNALWDSRLAIDNSLGLKTSHNFSFRYKLALTGKSPTNAAHIQSTTFVLGPFGDLVHYAKGKCYLSWYPDGCQHTSHEVVPPRWDLSLDSNYKSRVAHSILKSLSEIFLHLPEYITDPGDLTVGGGVIYSRGFDEITDPSCEVHQRYRVGVNRFGNYFSVDTGKLTLAPFFAHQAARMIGG